jgi:hypothetical protein
MEPLFNEHTAEHAREYLYRHPDDDKFVPVELHAPTLINMTAGGFMDAEFDGEPWFDRSDGDPKQHSRKRTPRCSLTPRPGSAEGLRIRPAGEV